MIQIFIQITDNHWDFIRNSYQPITVRYGDNICHQKP